MVLNRVVARFKDGSLIKGRTNDFSPDRKSFHLEVVGGEMVRVDMEALKTVEIDMEELKAAFFVKDYEGNKYREDIYGDVITGSGKKVKVHFTDGEVIIGYALSYSPLRHGFFVTPADLRSNNERIFVVHSATAEVNFI